MKLEQPHLVTDNTKSGESNHQMIELYTSFAKAEKQEADEDGFIYIEGYASTDDIDRHGDIVPADVWNRKALRNFRKNPIVLYNHDRSEVIGKVVNIEKREKGLFVKCAIDAMDNIGRKIGQGLLKTFSIGFYLLDFDYNQEAEAWVIKALELLEISVVSIPANQDATFSLAKQLGGEKEVKQLRQKLLGTDDRTSSDDSFNHNNTHNQDNTKMEDNRSWFQKTFGLGTTPEQATEELKAVAAEKNALQQQVESLTQKFNALETQVNTLQTEVSDLEAKNAELATAKSELEGQVEALTTQNDELQASVNEKEETANSLEAAKAEMTNEIETLKATIAKSKGIKQVAKGGSDPVLGGRKKSFTSPNAEQANKNLEYLKNR